jgi:hypothetical protein
MKMKLLFLYIIILLVPASIFAQQSDFIVLKKRNNRTVKTYSAGSFISATTYSGFQVSGLIRAIRNDSILVQQKEVRLMPTDFGSTLDTIEYPVGVYYKDLKSFDLKSKKGFSQVTIPKLMMIGGAGYIALELINTAYRKESLSEDNKMTGLGIALGVFAAGFVWNQLSKHKNETGKAFRVVYVKSAASY